MKPERAHRTLYDKIVDAHSVRMLDAASGLLLLYIDRTVLNEYTSPQAFSGLREAHRRVWRPEAALGVVDHVNPTAAGRTRTMPDPGGQLQTDYFAKNCAEFGIELFDVLHPMQGIEHVVMPELGAIMPGMTVAAGDSHTTTYGAFGALGFGIGTSDIEHYLATQTVIYRRLKNMRVNLSGRRPQGITAKDIVMALIRKIGASGATGYAIEFAGAGLGDLSVEGRMTICNMAVECGARGAIAAPDEAVFAYVADKPRAPRGEAWERAVAAWRRLKSDDATEFDREVDLPLTSIEPMVTWGTSPDQSMPISAAIPDPRTLGDADKRRDYERALDYMGLAPGQSISSIKIDRAFIGSCTNARIEDLREAAFVLRGRKVAPHVRAMIVPGSSSVRRQAEAEGLDLIFKSAGFEWRQAGCSMCLAMNDDVLAPEERCASSTNRNFEGRQGARGRTHLMSPAMVAAAAVAGRLADVRAMDVPAMDVAHGL
ncbi:MAG: 3-isopropylmalate dehydratase large subunit [Chloroflexota bacterium]|nr:3-isopropylmalate dehydratase large subunit [Hyphomonadaceae bacterium]GIK76293.1 MAG: 3-isopropylmalate dehydratase large subunit [Chloroflexota bacterium]